MTDDDLAVPNTLGRLAIEMHDAGYSLDDIDRTLVCVVRGTLSIALIRRELLSRKSNRHPNWRNISTFRESETTRNQHLLDLIHTFSWGYDAELSRDGRFICGLTLNGQSLCTTEILHSILGIVEPES